MWELCLLFFILHIVCWSFNCTGCLEVIFWRVISVTFDVPSISNISCVPVFTFIVCAITLLQILILWWNLPVSILKLQLDITTFSRPLYNYYEALCCSNLVIFVRYNHVWLIFATLSSYFLSLLLWFPVKKNIFIHFAKKLKFSSTFFATVFLCLQLHPPFAFVIAVVALASITQ